MHILAIETSCDETALALIQTEETADGTIQVTVLENLIHTQIDIHREFGGVFPALAKREHQKNIVPMILKLLRKTQSSLITETEKATGAFDMDQQPRKHLPSELQETLQTILAKEPLLYEQFTEHLLSLSRPQIDAICVTNGPGLEPALWVGINTAQALGFLWNIPVIPVNHMEGHLVSVLVPEHALPAEQENVSSFSFHKEPFALPVLALLVSGGHTEMIQVDAIGKYHLIGKTRDDAVGEAFDKVARIIGLPYPGGPEIAHLADNYHTHPTPAISFYEQVAQSPSLLHEPGSVFPRPMIHSSDYDFSFSGLKTAVRYLVEAIKKSHHDEIPQEFLRPLCYEFEEAATDVIVSKTKKAIEETGAQTLVVGGGVAANHHLRKVLTETLEPLLGRESIIFPGRGLTGDNALMIALAGYFKIQRDPHVIYSDIKAEGNMTLS